MALKLITAPTTLPVTLAEAKAHIRVDIVDDDTTITAMLGAAVQMAEQATGRALMPQTWKLTLDDFPDAFELTRVPGISITAVTYVDTAGATQTLSNALYRLDNADDFGYAYVVPAYGTSWPDTNPEINAVTVTYVAGYADAASVPEAIKSWIKLQVGAMYENREAETAQRISPVKLGFVDALLNRYKVTAL